MNRYEVLDCLARLRGGVPMIIGPGLANYPIAEQADDPMTIYNMDMPYATPMALGVALGRSGGRVVAIEGDGSLLAGPGVLTTIDRHRLGQRSRAARPRRRPGPNPHCNRGRRRRRSAPTSVRTARPLADRG